MDKKAPTQTAKLTRLYNLLQICARAGQLKTGYDSVSKMIGQRRARLVLLAEDFSERNKQRIMRICEEAGVPVFILGTMAEYSCQFSQRATGIIMTPDRNFARGLLKIISGDNEQANLEV
ncbi:MAG: ribosomal L7Ae/L30e/S12e/Gadd45 family protein [Candidatus Cloacimonetes bacterium]|nr:ribosomal L7Ae/L30e/S12e/Gadd45 family protein [Candidatus Cloacimonadota bacterium]